MGKEGRAPRALLAGSAAAAVVAAAAAAGPVIGVYPTSSDTAFLRITREWVEQEGATTVVLPSDFSAAALEELFQSVNGFVIPGLPVSALTEEAGRPVNPAVLAMLDRATQANGAGDYFPVWGICKGYEWMMQASGGAQVVRGGFDAVRYPAALNLSSSEAAASRTYSGANASLLSWLSSEAITYNDHSLGVSPQQASRGSRLAAAFNVLATSAGRGGRTFVAQVEGTSLPFYGTQFHPEKIEFQHGASYSNIPRTPEAVAAARFLARFFVAEAGKNAHHPTTS